MKNLQEMLPNFNVSLYQAIDQAWILGSDAEQQLHHLSTGADLLLKAIAQIGDLAFEEITGEKQSLKDISTEELIELLKWYLLNYRWPEQAKALLILWRDVLLEQQKAHILKKDGKVSDAGLEAFQEQSKITLKNAIEDLKAFLPQAIEESRRSKRGGKKAITQWRLQTNPWPIYKIQMETIPQQCEELNKQHQITLNTWNSFRQIKETILNMISQCHSEIDTIKKMVADIATLIEQELEKKDTRALNRIAAKLEDKEATILLPNHLNTFTNILEGQTNKLPSNWKVAIDTDGGLLQMRSLNLKKRVQQWTESEVLPLLYEIWENTEAASHGMKMVCVNIRNRAVLLSSDSAKESSGLAKELDFEHSDVATPLHSFLKNIEEQENVMMGIEGILEKRLNKDFKISNIYKEPQNFLPVPLQSTINQFKIGQNKQLIQVRSWLKRQWLAVARLQKSVRQEETRSISEKIARYLQSLALDPENNHYSSIFLTKGYVGESFVVGRADELLHVRQLVADWQKGYRGAIMLTGRRFSGKSLFGELVANRFFPEKAIRLSPESPLKVQSRKMQTSFDLKPALEFIRKYTLNEHPLVWIDDLELWWSPEVPLYKNVRTLAKFIDDYSANIFFVISMSNWLKAHLQAFLEIDKVFQTEINMDNMSKEEVRQAIVIRHGATHRNLVNKEGEKLSPKALSKIANNIFWSSKGNIGDSLNKWAFATKKVGDKEVINNFSGKYALPDFVNGDIALLLSSILLQKRTNEYRLLRLFGPAFSTQYAHPLQRLITTGILQRQTDGSLEINEKVVNEIADALRKKS